MANLADMRIVIVGGGLAAATAAEELRERGYEGELALYAAEDHLPYERPPLSKEVLLGDEDLDIVYRHDADWYAEHDVELHLGEQVTGLDTEAKLITTDAGAAPYDRLLLATGAQPRVLESVAGADPLYLRTIEDNQALEPALVEGARVVIVGAGWIGLEVAAAARKAGASVTVVEGRELPLLGALGPEMAEVFATLHREHDVDLRLDTSVEGAERTAGGEVVVHTSGGDVTGDLLVVGTGATPDVTLAEAGGLEVGDGIVVDATLRTSDPDVYAVGDVALHDHPTLGRLRVEHWDNAIEQAKVAAHNLIGGEEPYERQPYFFTDQYDLGMEYVGHASPDDEVVTRGDVEGRQFQAYWVRDGLVVAAMHVNDWDASDTIKAAVGKPVD